MTEIGEDQNGYAIYGPDLRTAPPLLDTVRQPRGHRARDPDDSGQTDVRGVEPYYGVEMVGIEHLQLSLAGGRSNFTIDDTTVCADPVSGGGSPVCTPDPSTAIPAPELEVYGGGGDDQFTVKSIGAPTTITGGPGNDSVLVQAPSDTLTGILSRLTIDGTNDLVTQSHQVNTSDPDPTGGLIGQLLTQPLIVMPGNQLGTQNGTPYYDASLVPILVADSSGNISVRSVVLDSTGAITQVMVQERGVQEYGIQMYGIQKTNAGGNVLWLDSTGAPTTTNTGIPDLTPSASSASGAQPVWFNSSGNEVLDGTLTGVPVILPAKSTDPGALPVYVDPAFNKVLLQQGPSLLTNGNLQQQVVSDGTGGNWTTSNVDSNGGWSASGPSGNGMFILNSNGDAATDPTIQQTLTDLLPGVTYVVSGEYANIYPQFGTNNTTTTSFGAFMGGSSFTVAKPNDTNFHAFSFSFTSTGTTATLVIKGEMNGQDTSYSVSELQVQAVNTPSYVTNFSSGSSLLYSDGSGRETTTATGNTALLLPVDSTTNVPFERVADVIAPGGGNDTLTIDSTGATSDLNATLESYQVPVDELSSGVPVLHGEGLPAGTYPNNPDPKFYFGGEPVIDPLTLQPMTYTTDTVQVRDLFTGALEFGPSGQPVFHQIGDPILHVAGDPVVQLRGAIQAFLGGEQVFDAQGNPVFTGSQPFLESPGEAVLSAVDQQIYMLVQSDGSTVDINSNVAGNPFNPPTAQFPSGISSSTVIDVSTLITEPGGGTFNIPAGAQIGVTIYDDSNIFDLAPGEFTVSGNQVLLNNLTAGHTTSAPITVKLTIAVPKTHAAGDAVQYVGNEPVMIGQPVVDSQGGLQQDDQGNLIVYTAQTASEDKQAIYYYTGSGQRLTLAAPATGNLVVMFGTTQLTTSDYTLTTTNTSTPTGTVPVSALTLSPSATFALGTTITITYTGPVLHASGDPVYTFNGTNWVQERYAGGEPALTTGAGAVFYRGGEQAYYTTADPVQTPLTLQRITVTGAQGMPGDIIYTGLSAVTLKLGSGNDLVTVQSTHTGTTDIQTGAGNDEVAIRAINGPTTVETGAGSDTVDVGSEAGLWLDNTTHQSSFTDFNGTLAGITSSLTVDGGAATTGDQLNVDETGDTVGRTGTLTSTQISGLGLPDPITYTNFQALHIVLGSGNDTFTIASTHAGPARTTTVEGGIGNDQIYVQTIDGPTTVAGDRLAPAATAGSNTIIVGSLAPNLGGTLSGIHAYLDIIGGETIGGQPGQNSLIVDDTGDTSAQISTLRDSQLLGAGMTMTPSTDPGGAALGDLTQAVTVTNAVSGDFTLTVGGQQTTPLPFDADAATVQAALEALLGVGNVAVSKSGNVYVVAFQSALAGAAGWSVGAITGDGSALGGTGAGVTVASASTGRIDYVDFPSTTVSLGSGGNTVKVDSTDVGTTTLNTGSGNDVIAVQAIGGPTTVNGQAGNDITTVNALPWLRSTPNGIAALLTLDGGTGSNAAIVNMFGNGNSEIDVTNTGLNGTNSLTINGTPLADPFVLRADGTHAHGYVDLLNTPAAGAFGQSEEVTYDQTTSGLTVDGTAGGDTFALDDNAAPTTINAGPDASTFQIGQIYGVSTLATALGLTATSAGSVSAGVTYATTINGGAGDDQFTVLHTMAPLTLNGGGGSDTFLARSLTLPGATAGNVSYLVDWPVTVTGGAGFNYLTVLGTGFGDNLAITQQAIFGAGMVVNYTGTNVNLDAAGGDSNFYALGTAPDAVVVLHGGPHSTYNIAGDVIGNVIALNPDGTAATINHSISSADPNYNGIFAAGVPVSVLGSDSGQIQINQSGPLTVVQQSLEPIQDAGYTLSLGVAKPAPGTIWYVEVSAGAETGTGGNIPILLSADGGVTWFSSLVLTFDSSAAPGSANDWSRVQPILVSTTSLAPVDDTTVEITHELLSTGSSLDNAASGFAMITGPSVAVKVVNAGDPGIVAGVAPPACR